jgi:2,4-dienoyl-CoA reductase-like NADH-dependent reductase (Old Yellow Enzyme family)
MTTHGTKLSEVRYLQYLEERARGGVGLIGIPAAYGVATASIGAGR